MRKTHLFAGIFAATAALAIGGQANADTVSWATWITQAGPSGSASATIGSTTVTYSGEVESVMGNYPSWLPTGSYVGGTVGNAPPQSGGIVQLFGGNAITDTITFSTPVVDPVMAIWSLGQPGNPGINAEFDFTSGEPFTIQAGGASIEYGGQAITSSGETVFGVEGNGTIQFSGTYSSISWTNPVFEDWYGFTVGTVPLPASALSGGVLLAGMALANKLRRRRQA